jgi:hypothetical protein
VEKISFFYDFCLTVRGISRNQISMGWLKPKTEQSGGVDGGERREQKC